MHDREGFGHAIDAAYAAQDWHGLAALRGVYADWLEERGDGKGAAAQRWMAERGVNPVAVTEDQIREAREEVERLYGEAADPPRDIVAGFWDPRNAPGVSRESRNRIGLLTAAVVLGVADPDTDWRDRGPPCAWPKGCLWPDGREPFPLYQTRQQAEAHLADVLEATEAIRAKGVECGR